MKSTSWRPVHEKHQGLLKNCTSEFTKIMRQHPDLTNNNPLSIRYIEQLGCRKGIAIGHHFSLSTCTRKGMALSESTNMRIMLEGSFSIPLYSLCLCQMKLMVAYTSQGVPGQIEYLKVDAVKSRKRARDDGSIPAK